MSKIINAVVDIHSKKERIELAKYVGNQEYLDQVKNDQYDGFQLVLVESKDRIGNIGVIVAEHLVNKCGYKHYSSVIDFIRS